MSGTFQSLSGVKPRSLEDEIDAIEPPSSLAEQIDATPTQGKLTDAAKRAGRSMVDQPGAVTQGLGHLLDMMERSLRAYGAAQAGGDNAMLPARLQRPAENPAEAMERELRRPSESAKVVVDTGKQMRADAGQLYTGDFAPDPARNQETLAQVADNIGPLAASIATPGGVVAKTMTGAALNSQGAADEAEQAILQRGGTEDDARAEAARQFVLNLPAGALESVAWGRLLGRYGKTLENAVSEKFGKDALRRILKATGEQALVEGGEEGLQQIAQNAAAKATYDPERNLTEGAGQATKLGMIMGGGLAGSLQTGAEVATKLDTGRNTPERPEDLKAQQEQLLRGDRAVQMFPLGTDELPMPRGMQRVETPRGAFHFDPARITADEILTASKAGKENLLLGLGPVDKAEVDRRARAGEPLATVVERGQNGEELRAAAATPSTAGATRSAMEAGKSEGSTVQLEKMADTLRGRTGGIDDMIEQAATEQKQRADQVEKENAEREKRQAAAKEKRDKLAFHLENAGRLLSGEPKPAEVQGAVNVLRDYTTDNTLGLTLAQRQEAQQLLAKLEPMRRQMQETEEAATAARVDAARQQKEQDDAAQRQRIATEKKDLAAQAGIDPTTGKKRIEAMSEDELTEAAQGGDEAAMREMHKRSNGNARPIEEHLLQLMERTRVKLPADDEALGGELRMLREEMNAGQQMRFFRRDGKVQLDRVAQTLREHGFTQLQTPADVISAFSRALRGEKIMPAGKPEDIDFATEEREDSPHDSAATSDAFTGIPSHITGSRVTAAQALRIAERNRAAQVRPAETDARTEGGVAGQKLVNLGIIRDGDELVNPATGKRIPLLGHGIEAEAYADPAEGVVYKVFIPGEAGSLAQRLTIDKDGMAMMDTGGPADLVEKIRVINALGGTPTELLGYTADNELVVKQPRGAPRAWENAKDARTAARLVNVPRDVLDLPMNAAPIYLSMIDGQPVLVSDLNKNNYIGDTLGRSRINDLITRVLTPEDLKNAPKLAKWIPRALQEFDARAPGPAEFAQTEELRRQMDGVTEEGLTDFEGRLQRIAPGLMMEYRVLTGGPEHLQRLVPGQRLSGREQAAHFPRRKLLWFLQQNLRAGADGLMEERLRRDVLHETTHAWLDSIDADTKDELQTRWAADVKATDGWLATMRKDEVKLRKGVETDWQEYWAERIAQENDKWAARREGTMTGNRGLVSQLAYDFRRWFKDAVDYLQQAFTRTKRYNVDFRAFLEDARFPEPSATPAPLPMAAAQADQPSFAIEEQTPDERRRALVRDMNRITREADRAMESGNNRRLRNLQGQRSEIRTQLDSEFPEWRKLHPEGPDGLREEGATPPADENAGAEASDTERTATPMPDREFAERPHIYSEVEGHTQMREPWAARTWEKIGGFFRGFRGSIPELPAFADDQAQEFSRLRQFNKLIKRGTPRVWKEASDRIGSIVQPLLAVGKLDPDSYARLAKLQNRVRQLREDGRAVSPEMLQEIGDLNREVEREPYGLFQKLALYLDLKWRVENLKDEQGNAITQPGGLNVQEINDRLAQLKEILNASPHRELIVQALREHQTMAKEIAADLKARDLTMPEDLQNPFYFPHIVLEKGKDTLDRVKLDTQEDFRGYLMKPVGSNKPIETDYAKAMYYHLVAVGSHNLRSDLVQDYVKPYDKMQEVRDRAKELAKQYGRPVSWREAFATDYAKRGFSLFYPDDKLPLHPEMTVNRDTLARRLGVILSEAPLQGQLEALGLKGIKLLPQDITEALAAGERETWILPEKVAEALNGMLAREGKSTDSMISKPVQMFQGLWKRNILFAPWNYPRYEFNNTVADLEKLFSVDPEVYRLLPAAAREVRQFIEDGKGGRDVHEAFKLGVLDSVTAAEVNDLTALRQFEKLKTTGDNLADVAKRASTLFLAGNRSTMELSKLREATFRFAKFKADLDRLRNGARPIYAGAYWKDVDAIQDSRQGANDANYHKAAEISLATFGDYNNISVTGQELRRYLIPFYSWMEINFRYHANLFRNLKDMAAAGEMSNAEATKTGAKVAAVFTRKAAAGALLRLALPYLAVTLWNNSGDRDELEETLSAEDRRRFHIILGKDDKGKTRVLYAQTAFADVIKWFGGTDAMRLGADYMSGRTDLGTALSDWMKQFPRDFVNNLFQVGPAVKIGYTLASKKNTFPDVTDQRTIPAYDLKWNILGQATDQFTAELIRRAMDKDYLAPRDVKDWAQQTILQVRKRDPEQWAFYEIKDKAAQFLEDKTGQSRSSDFNAPDQQVLRNFRKAIYRGDVENAMRFYDRLLELGYTAERFKASIRAQDPLSELPKDMRDDFVAQLSPFERRQLSRAFEFYTRMTENRGAERSLFPSERMSEGARQRYAPRHERLQMEMGKAQRLSDEERAIQAERELHRSLRPSQR